MQLGFGVGKSRGGILRILERKMVLDSSTSRDLSIHCFPIGLAAPIKPYPGAVILFIEYIKTPTPQKAVPKRIKRISTIHKKSQPMRSVDLDRIDLFLTHFLLNLRVY